MKNSWLGNIPKNGKVVAENGGWMLYLLDRTTPEFINLKLVSRIRRTKANYWLGFNRNSLKMSNGWSEKSLLDKHPEIYDWVLVVLLRIKNIV